MKITVHVVMFLKHNKSQIELFMKNHDFINKMTKSEIWNNV